MASARACVNLCSAWLEIRTVKVIRYGVLPGLLDRSVVDKYIDLSRVSSATKRAHLFFMTSDLVDDSFDPSFGGYVPGSTTPSVVIAQG